MKRFEEEYQKLNKEQKDAVDTIDGPVMVVAGPGTGKTQVLALRIGYILKNTDTKADSVLCLTFTNSGVKAMRERLYSYIGSEALKVKVATFHSFGMEMVEKFHASLGLVEAPKLMDEKDAIAIVDDILEGNPWGYIRPRGNAPKYFRDLKSMVSTLKRERITPAQFEKKISEEIASLNSDPDNISSRGPSKGELKKEIKTKIEALHRTEEAMRFYELYEKEKKLRNIFDYDDVLEALVEIVENDEEVKNTIREDYLYVLIDEHQDSSGLQNQFLKSVWRGVENPNIFVVGDDRQLIYGFGGASLEYFKNFQHEFGEAKLITLAESYRSTQNILDSSHDLLQSSITKDKLRSNHPENHPLRLIEACYPRDEVILFGLEVKEMLKDKKADMNDIALLVPKNKQVVSAMAVLRDMGVPVATTEKLNFFDSSVAKSLINVLKVIAEPNEGGALAISLFDPLSGIPPLDAHKFVRQRSMKGFSLTTARMAGGDNLFSTVNPAEAWIARLEEWLTMSQGLSVYSLIQNIAESFLIDTAKDHEELVERVEVVRTLLHLVLARMEKDPKIDLKKFITFLDRIESYGEHIPIATFGASEGVKVLTLHGSKGLEFDFVWIAHMDEKSLSGGGHSSFALPASITSKLEEKEEEVLKKQLYVALTRAKRFCTISYSLRSYTGADQRLANAVLYLESGMQRMSAKDTEDMILKKDPREYIKKNSLPDRHLDREELKKLVSLEYPEKKVSVSLLNNFFECPWKWYFRNLLQLPEPKSESLEFGNIIHGSIDQILRLAKKPTDAAIRSIVEAQVWKTGFGTDIKQRDLIRDASQIVKAWTERRLPEINKQRKNEESVSLVDDRYPHLSIYGKIDLIEMLSEKDVRVTDFKTGSPRKKSDIEKIDEEGRMDGYMRQLAMYSYLLSDTSRWNKKVVESKLEFLQATNPSEASYSTNIGNEQIDRLIQDITDYDQIVKSGEWLIRECHFKSYGKQDAVCEYCTLALIYK